MRCSLWIHTSIYVFALRRADISDDRIAKDLAVAESIWHPITFQIQEVIVLNELFRFSDREISYKDSIQSQEKLASFFKLV